jgi:hypothetical protein
LRFNSPICAARHMSHATTLRNRAEPLLDRDGFFGVLAVIVAIGFRLVRTLTLTRRVRGQVSEWVAHWCVRSYGLLRRRTVTYWGLRRDVRHDVVPLGCPTR